MRAYGLVAIVALAGCQTTTSGTASNGTPETDRGFTVQDGCLKNVIEGQIIPIVDERGRKICE